MECGETGRLSVKSGREGCAMDVAIAQEYYDGQLAPNDRLKMAAMPVLPSRTQASVD